MEKHLNNLIKLIPDLKNMKILDVGSGRGDFLIECAKRNIDAMGIELNPKYIEISSEKAHRSGLNVKIIRGQSENIPFEDNSFDFVNCSEVIEHVEDPKLTLKEIYRVLKPNGLAYISVHNRFGIYDHHFHTWFLNWMPRSLGELYLRLLRKHKEYDKMPDNQKISKMHYFTFLGFKKTAEKYGFKVSDTKIKKLEDIKIFRYLKKQAMLLYYLLNIFLFSTFHLLVKKL